MKGVVKTNNNKLFLRRSKADPFGMYFLLFLLIFSHLNAAEEEYQFKGNHFLASYCECDQASLADLEGLSEAMHVAVQESGATILDKCSWVFPPDGITMVFLLSESHASIHTYPEHGACFVDLFTCGDHCSAEKFDVALRRYLQPKQVNARTLIRDQAIIEK